MNIIIKSILLAILLATVSQAEIVKVFNLKDNIYANVTDKKANRYKINDNLMLTMQLNKTASLDGYRTESIIKSNLGYFELKVKNKKINNWVCTIDFNFNGESDNPNRQLIFTDDGGLSIPITYNSSGKNKIKIGEHEWGISPGRLLLKVVRTNDQISYYLNDKKFHIEKKRFGNIRSISHNFSSYDKRIRFADVLVNVTLSEIK